MAVGMFFIIIIAVAIAIVIVPAIAASRGSSDRELKDDLRLKSQQLKVARRALNMIGSGTTGNPTAEAQSACDTIDNLDMKELN